MVLGKQEQLQDLGLIAQDADQKAQSALDALDANLQSENLYTRSNPLVIRAGLNDPMKFGTIAQLQAGEKYILTCSNVEIDCTNQPIGDSNICPGACDVYLTDIGHYRETPIF